MCAICGVIYSDPQKKIDQNMLVKMRDAMVHRGPDDTGFFAEPGIGLGSRRLAILDLSEKGHMPMKTRDGRYTMVYNGEIFNYKELRSELLSKGYHFESNTDTEVVLNLYADQGPRMLERLNGMFALAIWDTKERTLFIARDQIGIKPLYYIQSPEAFYFASEPKAFFEMELPREFNEDVWEELLCFRFVAGEETCFKNVKRLLPGHYLLWKNGQATFHRWWHLGERAKSINSLSRSKTIEYFRYLFDDAVKIRTISDVPLGVFLSGGLDSSSIAASLASQLGTGIKTFMIRFKDAHFDEGPLAHALVKKWGLDHHEIYGETPDLLTALQESTWYHDEPLAHGNDLYFYILSCYAKDKATVLLTGEGSDEILAGYVRYLPFRCPHLLASLQNYKSILNPLCNISNRFKKLKNLLRAGSVDKMILYNSSNFLPHQLAEFGFQTEEKFSYRKKMLEEAKRYHQDALHQAMYLDQHTFLCSLLDRNDRMTMGASIECRPPFLDVRLIELAAHLSEDLLFKNNRGKRILREAMKSRLPAEILKYRKWGFGVPWGHFLRQDKKLKEYLINVPDREPFLSGPLDRIKLKSCIHHYLEGSEEYASLILEVLMIAVWYEVFFVLKGAGRPHPRS